MQSVRPRTILAPLQIGLGVQMHRQFGSRILVDTLNALGFCVSYTEVQRFERSASVTQGTEITGHTEDMLLQFVADNVDHNVRTLDGLNTFHGMGIITTVTPGNCSSKIIPRVSATSDDVKAVGTINIKYFKPQDNFNPILTFQNLIMQDSKDDTYNADILWKISWLLKPTTPSWNGFMQMIQKGHHPGKSMVFFMPMIDLKPSDEHCVYSTMCFVADEAKKYQVTPILTFDQPLWWKATEIQQHQNRGDDLHNIILRLGGLHIEMSFLGSIGHLMGGSGLKEALEIVYADNTVSHMLTGHAISRAIRGHLLVVSVLYAILLSLIYNIQLPNSPQLQLFSDSENIDEDVCENVDAIQDTSMTHHNDALAKASVILTELTEGSTDIKDACLEDVWDEISQALIEYKKEASKYRTPKLWFQYLNMIEILQTFIKAERIGNWTLHLKSLYQMLPFFAAAGHNFYTKSVYLYLQNMSKLSVQHPDVYSYFMEGFHVVRRSDRYWAGLSTDLVIEQMLMKSMKTSGGLTRGRGMTELQRTIWLLSTPACASVCQAMQQFTDVDSTATTDLHKEAGKSRLERDDNDKKRLCKYFMERNPFNKLGPLVSIASGVTSSEGVNVDDAEEVGNCILNGMPGHNALGFSFKKKDQAVTLAAKTSVKIDDEIVPVDPQLLFQRLISAARNTISVAELSTLFSFELCSHPPALFASDGLIRPAHKSQLADIIFQQNHETENLEITEPAKYVLDGGSLLHKIPWARGSTYHSICQQYIDYIAKTFGKNVIVVFDSYPEGPSTKDTTHIRRTRGNVGNTVQFTSTMSLTMKKELFLANSKNKQCFIDMLSLYLRQNGVQVKQAVDDADVLIVQTVVDCSMYEPTVLVGEDTDLVVLLCHFVDLGSYHVHFRPRPNKKLKTQRLIDIHKIKNNLGEDVCDNILFIHAILGCDTTSGVHGIGKSAALKKFKTNAMFRETALVFSSNDSLKGDVINAGETALVLLYGGRPGDTLDSLRFSTFFQKVATSNKCVKPEALPPTSAAGKYHSLRVYYQIQVWKGNTDLIPFEWGWKISKGNMLPISTDQTPAPETLLNVIRCKCKTDCRTTRCTCKKHGLECSAMCGECRGVSCLNSEHIDTTYNDMLTE